jgi:hypothetical protein
MTHSPHTPTQVSDLEQYLASLPPGEARTIINAGNKNGKTPFHHACQFRTSPEAAALLLRFGANIDKATRRGHTALIYACGRGREQTVATLLAAGANVKVTAVTGDDAISMAVGRVGAETLEMLQRAYEASAGPVLNYTTSADAQAAQAEHVAGCKHCLNKLARASTEEVPPTAHELVVRASLVERLEASVAQASEDAKDDQRNAVTAALVATAIALDSQDTRDFASSLPSFPPSASTCGDRHDGAVKAHSPSHLIQVHVLPDRFRGLKLEVAAFLRRHGASAVLCTLHATREERLGRCLNKSGVRDRKFPRIILSALMAALRAGKLSKVRIY